MSSSTSRRTLTRRDFLKMGGGIAGAVAGSRLLSKVLLEPEEVIAARPARHSSAEGQAALLQQSSPPADLHFIATDGWIYLPEGAAVPPYHPDNLAPPPFNTYIFGFRNVTAYSDNLDLVYAQKMKAQLSAPLFALQEGVETTLKLTNLGLELRPDLIDSHTLHFHGFRNAIPIFDGEPHSSVGVTINRELVYLYRPHDPGTYMYHCHFEETEHVHMGMVGPCYITPAQNYGATGVPAAWLGGNNAPGAPRGYVFNDGDGSTAYDREFIVFLSEVWAESHWCDSHIQLPEWSDYKPEFYLLNGRVYPDTLAPAGQGTNMTTGEPIAPSGRPELQYQPMSALIRANAGERVLLRIINLGYEHQSMRLDGIQMRVVGKDASHMRGLSGGDLSYLTNTVSIGPGESVDAIFVAPPHSGAAGYDRYLLYNRNYHRLNNGGHLGRGGQMTEVRITPPGRLPRQTEANT